MVDEVNSLCDRLRRIVRDAKAVLREEGSLDRAEQLRQIRGTIAVLRQQGLEVPETLLELERARTQQVTREDQATRTLGVLQNRLTDILRSIDPLAEPKLARRKAPPAPPAGTLRLFDE